MIFAWVVSVRARAEMDYVMQPRALYIRRERSKLSISGIKYTRIWTSVLFTGTMISRPKVQVMDREERPRRLSRPLL